MDKKQQELTRKLINIWDSLDNLAEIKGLEHKQDEYGNNIKDLITQMAAQVSACAELAAEAYEKDPFTMKATSLPGRYAMEEFKRLLDKHGPAKVEEILKTY